MVTDPTSDLNVVPFLSKFLFILENESRLNFTLLYPDVEVDASLYEPMFLPSDLFIWEEGNEEFENGQKLTNLFH